MTFINVVGAIAALALPVVMASVGERQSLTRELAAAMSQAEELSIQAFGYGDPTCQSWTDSCRTCTRGLGIHPDCSNIGIACQPKPTVCTRRDEPPKPDASAKQDAAPK